MTSINTILCTCPDQACAEKIATGLIEKGLASCVSIIPGLTSIYRWEGRIVKESEQLLLIKAPASQAEQLRNTIVEMHPYQVPEILELAVVGGHLPYLEWVAQCTNSA